MRPFTPLSEFSPHEQQLLSRLGKLVCEQKSHVRELLPEISRHLREHGSLSVDELVVRKRQDEILVKRVDHSKCELAVVILPMYRIETDIFQSIVHPPHVPLQTEAQSAQIRGPRYSWPRCRLFSDGLNVGMCAVDFRIEASEKLDGLNVFAASESVRYPFDFLSGVVEVKHRGDRINTKSIHVIVLQPEHGRTQQEATDLMTSVIEDVAVPVLVQSLPGIGVLV